MPDTMIGRIKSAIREEIAFEQDEGEDRWMVEGGFRSDQFFDDIARAVLTAMREPTGKMIDAMYDEYQGGGKGSLRDAYSEAIDAVLAEEG